MTNFTNKADEPRNIYDMIQYSTDRKGRTNYIKFGRIWLPVNGERGKMRFFALPLANAEGETIADMVLRDDPSMKDRE